jgi:hypothetical protein
MKTIPKFLIPGVFTASVLFASTVLADVGQWDFNSGNLSQSAGATLGDLTYADGPGGTTSTRTSFGTTTTFGIPNINGSPATVMKFPGATNGMGYSMPTPNNGNGGGSIVNEWTMIMDVLYPAASDATIRPIIDTDGSFFVAGPDFVVDTSDGIGSPPNGPYNGSVQPNTWYRIGIAVTANEVDIYVNGVQVATLAGAGLDNRFAVTPGSPVLILGSTGASAAIGYINSLQFRDAALNAGQMNALGGPSAAGIPITIPPVPSFIQTRSPGVNATGVSPTPDLHVVLNQGDTTVNSGSIQLLFDGASLASTVSPTPPTFDVTASITSILDPNSIHTLSLVWQDSTGTKTNTWSFTVLDYQNINLPTPFYFENFDGLTENPGGPGPLPAGWTVTNQTWPGNPGFSLDDRNSDSYMDWVLVSDSRLPGWGAARTRIPPIVLNGTMLTSLSSGNLMWAESDARCGSCWGQYQEMYTGNVNCTGRTNVYVAFKSNYAQNQDNMDACEYSPDGGANWLPVRYFFCTDGAGETSDIIYTNDASGHPVIDVGQTFSRIEANRNWAPWPVGCTDLATCPPHATNYGIYVKAPISASMIPYMKGYTNDAADNNDFPFSGKEIVVVRLPQADGRSQVKFRFVNDGTSAWFWGIDDFGLYEINTPVISSQPTNVTVSAGGTAVFNVVASSANPLTYRWRHAGTNLSNGGHFSGVTTPTLTVSNCETNDAGSYVCVVGNLYGNVNSASAILTVVTAPQIVTQPAPAISSINYPFSFSVVALGRSPLVYQWTRDGVPVGGNSSTLNLSNVQLSDVGRYQVTITNSEGSAVSVQARLIVSPAAITSNLVVHLTLDGNYLDTSGRGNNASDVGGTTFAPGKFGQAMKFTTTQDGSTIQYATLGYPDDLKFGSTTDFSISFWTDLTLTVDDPPWISNKNWDSSGNPGWGIFTQDNGHFRVNVTGTGGTKYDLGSGSTPLVRDGTWHNIILSYVRGSIVTVYVDATRVDTRFDLTTGSIDTDGLGYNVNIGQDGRGTYTDGGSAGITNALIDDVGIWRRALSSQEATAIYNGGNAGLTLSQVVAGTAGTLQATISGGNIHLTWSGQPTVKLQRSSSLSPQSWSDVAGTLGTSSATLPLTGGASFFRLSN